MATAPKWNAKNQWWEVGGQTPKGRKRQKFSVSKYGTKKRAQSEATQFYNDLLQYEQTGQWGERKLKKEVILFSDITNQFAQDHLRKNTKSEKNESYIKTINLRWGDYEVYPHMSISKGEYRQWIWKALHEEIPSCNKRGFYHYAASSVNSKLIGYAHSAFNWAISMEYIEGPNPLDNVRDRTLSKEIARLTAAQQNPQKVRLTYDEFWDFINWDELPKLWRGPFIMSFCSGMRRSELVNLKWSMVDGYDVGFGADSVKEAKDKNCTFEREALDVISHIQAENLINGIEPEYVFLNSKGGKIDPDTLTRTFRRWANRYAEYSGIEKFKKVSPHKLRSSYATRKVNDEGANPAIVGAQMGHSTQYMTDRYIYTDIEALRRLNNVEEELPEIDGLKETVINAEAQGMSYESLVAVIRHEWNLLKHNGKKVG